MRLHTHLAETVDEEEFCREKFGRSPAEYAEDLGWLGDGRVARALRAPVRRRDRPLRRHRHRRGALPDVQRPARRRASRAVARMLAAGVPVGLGVDGSASNESGRMVDELHQALLAARGARRPARAERRGRRCEMATMGGARVPGPRGELGSLEAGKLADLAVWRVDGLAGSGIADPVCTLVLGAPRSSGCSSAARSWDDGGLQTADAARWPAGGPAAARIARP